ncbi:MAG: glycosyltransferase family 92 protein [Desulfovibrio sp.]|jgi:hypothetical protein|nr:glycosyltransferase family 92 protein [Desulfovibrio sp.]
MIYTSICAIAKDENLYITEWVEYHLCLGFEHIYVYDNNSRISLRKTLAKYIDNGFITIIDFQLKVDQQRLAYIDCIKQFGHTTKWMAFIDIDEFFVPKIYDDIRDILDNYRKFGGLAVHWKIFGSNGYRKRPKGNIINNYTTVVNYNTHIKSIVQTVYIAGVSNPHSFIYKDGYYCVNEDMIPVMSHHSYHTSKTIQINHYYYKSFEEFKIKIERGRACNNNGNRRRGPEALIDFAQQEISGGCYDNSILTLQGKINHRLSDLEKFHSDKNRKFSGFADAISACIGHQEIDPAKDLIKRCLRYYDIPEAWLIAARFCLLTDSLLDCFVFIAKGLYDPACKFRDEFYLCLVRYYRAQGDLDTADSLQAELKA